MPPNLATCARRLNARTGATPLPALIYLSDEMRFPDPRPALLCLPRGAAMILRHYRHPARAGLARSLLKIARARGVKLLIAGDPALALRIRADGVHWPEGLVRPRPAAPKSWLVTAAAHSKPALRRAFRCGADAALLSPVFETQSGSGKTPLGIWRFAALAHASPVPVYALGGVNARTAPRLNGCALAGLAAIAAFET